MKRKNLKLLILVFCLIPLLLNQSPNNRGQYGDKIQDTSPTVCSPVTKVAHVSTQVSRKAITIVGDTNFTSENGISSGTGTVQDPYIIANWSIDGDGVNSCIMIVNTTKYFLLSNCTLMNATASQTAGIFLNNVTNGHLMSNFCNDSYFGIYLLKSNFNRLTNNTCTHHFGYGIYLYQGSSNNTLNTNLCQNNYYGIYVYQSSSSNILNKNTCNSNTQMGIELGTNTLNNLVTNNTCNYNLVHGIRLSQSSYNMIRNNNCSSNTLYGILCSGSDYITITGNFFNDEYYGMVLTNGDYFTIENNTCKGNNVGLLVNLCFYANLTWNFFQQNIQGINLEFAFSMTFYTNFISNNSGAGIVFTDSSDNVFYCNWMWDNANDFSGTVANNEFIVNFFYVLGIYDTDNDGLSDEDEVALGTSPVMVDTDGDNFLDGYECDYGSNPLDKAEFPLLWQEDYETLLVYLEGNTSIFNQLITWIDGNATLLQTVYALTTGNTAYLEALNISTITQFDELTEVIDELGISIGDTDYDGLTDLEELIHGTSLVLADTDNDNLIDAYEIKIGTDPSNDDSDGDSFLDGHEIFMGTDPNDNQDFPGSDSSSSHTSTTSSNQGSFPNILFLLFMLSLSVVYLRKIKRA